MSTKCPEKKGARYTEPLGVRIEKDLHNELKWLKVHSVKDIPEGIRIKVRELVQELKAEVEASSKQAG